MVSATTSSSPASAEDSADSPKRIENIPETRAQAADTSEGVQQALQTAEFPIHYLGLTWVGAKRGAAIRFHQADGAMGTWQDLRAGCAGGVDGTGLTDSARAAAVLVPAAGAFGYELSLPDGAESVCSIAIDATKGPVRQVILPAEPTRALGQRYFSRAAWGADEAKRFYKDGTESSKPIYFPVQALTVHHTVTPNNDPDPAATVRAIYEQHASKDGADYGDIAYHFLIDAEGRVYEGRYSGEDGIPAHDKEGNAVTAFHTKGYNSGNIGIALLGTFTDQQPTDAAREKLVVLLAGLAKAHSLDPEANITFINPRDGVKKNVPAISGHKDWQATECPGAALQGELSTIRREVAALVKR
ncbi:peptidoglycan recognition family protein [Streptomyces sp. NPDC048637]|uniref:peptidoglycan recognition protein family protein n=1 Tax=Streptomyces sp. NPDC048637 TaxID=3155636 RepID=UPI00344AE1A4